VRRLWTEPDRLELMTALRADAPRSMQAIYEALADDRLPRCRFLLRHDWRDIDWKGIARSGHVALRAVACPTCGLALEVTDGGAVRRWRLDAETRRRWRNQLR
jgi:hypothetical protein